LQKKTFLSPTEHAILKDLTGHDQQYGLIDYTELLKWEKEGSITKDRLKNLKNDEQSKFGTKFETNISDASVSISRDFIQYAANDVILLYYIANREAKRALTFSSIHKRYKELA
jgi:hypothetical protein